MDIRVLDENPIYKDEAYRLKFKFSSGYPIGESIHSSSPPYPPQPPTSNLPLTLPLTPPPEPPEVTFTPSTTPPRPIPLHPHIYSNGIICLDLLDRAGWTPVHNVESVCMSIQSMLTGNTRPERPPGDDDFVRRNTLRPRDINFLFHDERV